LSKIIPVILSGGKGTRLWPLSRKQFPKQYLKLLNDNTMLQNTLLNLDGLKGLGNPIIVCNSDHRFLVAEQCREIGISYPVILLEPVSRSTAPAITAAALQTIKDLDDAILLVLSADHLIKDIKMFHKAINIAIKKAQSDKLVTIGVVPKNANINYGYIKFTDEKNAEAFRVEKFVEKPNKKNAESFIVDGGYLWNSGIFVFQANTLINEMKVHSSKISLCVKKSVDNAKLDLNFIRLDKKAFKASPAESIDYALMEKSKNLFVVPLDSIWEDIGSWSTLYDKSPKDKNGNVLLGDVLAFETRNTYINASHHLVAAIGLKDVVIIDTPNATLISSSDKVNEVKKIVEQLDQKNRDEQAFHRKVYRPWGWFDSIEKGKHFQVKRLCVNPKSKLSLQLHESRAEHWVVVSGVASVVNGNDSLSLTEGESTFIPRGTKHSLENLTNELLEVIEVQSGVYLGEDDIVRFDDIYGRISD
jgi:mannose-1-phosphate guanylyltransferase/mannose-6-phosphate isomerase